MRKAGLFIFMLGLVIWVGCATTQNSPNDGGAHDPLTKHYGDTLYKITDNGKYGVEILLPDQKVEMGVNKIDLLIHDMKDRDVTGARITVTPWMPSMEHGVSEKPLINERADGLYSVANVVFSMTGNWELRVRITDG